jgi:hypothetical protein
LVDFNGDGRLHLLSGSNCCDPLGFHFFRRKADGSWAPRQRLEVTYPGKFPPFRQESFVTTADWNGDGIPDLLAVGPYGQGILLALGPFREKEPIALSQEIDFTPRPVPGEGYVLGFGVADWDRDGKPDLLVQHSSQDGTGGIYWYQNLGGPGLPKLAAGKLLVESTRGMHVRGFCVCDWNGDGWPDLIVTRDEARGTNDQGRPVGWRGSVWLYLRE